MSEENAVLSDAARFELGDELARRLRPSEVRHHDLDPHTRGPFDLAFHGLQPLGPPGHQHERAAAPREEPGQLGSDAAGGSGDDGPAGIGG